MNPQRSSTGCSAPSSLPPAGPALRQPADGYRYSADALLLADFTARLFDRSGASPRCIVDACSGCGVVGLVLAHRWPTARIRCVERDPELHGFCEANVRDASLEDRVFPLHADLRRWAQGAETARADLVVMNPPFHPAGSGRLNPHPQRAAARHQLHGDIAELIEACATLLEDPGHLCVVYPTSRLQDLIAALQQQRLVDLTLQFVHGRVDGPSPIVLVGAVRSGARHTRTLAPLVHPPPGSPTGSAGIMEVP